MSEIVEQPNKMLGLIAQAAEDAAQKKLTELCKKDNNDPAYWAVKITTELIVLDSNFSVLEVYRLEKIKDNTYDFKEKDKGGLD